MARRTKSQRRARRRLKRLLPVGGNSPVPPPPSFVESDSESCDSIPAIATSKSVRMVYPAYKGYGTVHLDATEAVHSCYGVAECVMIAAGAPAKDLDRVNCDNAKLKDAAKCVHSQLQNFSVPSAEAVMGSVAQVCALLLTGSAKVLEETAGLGRPRNSCTIGGFIPNRRYFSFKPEPSTKTSEPIPVPMGVLLTMPPTGGAFSPEMYGQMYHSLVFLQAYFGIQHPIGILSDMLNWQVVWLPSSDAYMTSTSTVPSRDSFNLAQSTLANINTHMAVPDLLHPMDLSKAKGQPLMRSKGMFSVVEHPLVSGWPIARLYDAPFDWVDSNCGLIVDTIVSAVSRMFAAPRPDQSSDTILERDKTRVVVSTTSNVLQTTQSLPKSFTFNICPVRRSKAFVLLQDFVEGGSDGRVWLAANSQGDACVVKLMIKQDPNRDTGTVADFTGVEEAMNWCSLGQHAYQTTLAGLPAVVMPFMMPISKDQWRDWDTNGVKEAAQDLFALLHKLGKEHHSIKCSHMGLYINHQSKLSMMVLDNTWALQRTFCNYYDMFDCLKRRRDQLLQMNFFEEERGSNATF